MDYEKMFTYLISISLTWSIMLSFFSVAMPETAGGILPSSITFSTYTQEQAVEDINNLSGTREAASTSEATQGDTFNLTTMIIAWQIFSKILYNTFMSYYNLSIYFADAIESSAAGPIHILFGGIGTLISIIVIVAFIFLLRGVIFKV